MDLLRNSNGNKRISVHSSLFKLHPPVIICMSVPIEYSKAPKQDAAALNREWFGVQSEVEFVEGSPHLSHVSLRAYFYSVAREVLQTVAIKDRRTVVLDMGAGDGALTLPYLEVGASVTAADVTLEFLESLRERSTRYRESLTILPGDIFETLRNLVNKQEKFDLVCASSFLHHIPDYLELCRLTSNLVRKGGIFFTFQDPLRYDTLSTPARVMERAGYFSWRLFQGNYLRGVKTRIRRLFKVYRPELAEDMVEFHVVRDGVDHLGIKALLESSGFTCEIRPYWSTHSGLFQRFGERLRLVSNFALIATKTS
jgi:2-polyprenyl-3-methyl-5-hydroxy-6-metoxy-1,4-benzoquinol methylase